MNIGIDHGYYAIKTRHCSFPAGITAYGSQEPYTRRNLLEFGGHFYLCGTGRQPLQKDKTQTDSYYLLTLAAIVSRQIRPSRLAGFRPASSQSDRSTACVGWLPSRTIS